MRKDSPDLRLDRTTRRLKAGDLSPSRWGIGASIAPSHHPPLPNRTGRYSDHRDLNWSLADASLGVGS